MSDLTELVRRLMTEGKGILAADESTGTCNARFEEIGIETTEENRRRWRELLLTTPGVEKYITGVILFDETLRQATTSGKLFPELLFENNILVGIKVDEGLEDGNGGQVTRGLATLPERLEEYKTLGATFTKWRAVAKVGDGYGDPAILENAKRMAEYASRVLAAGMVPIVEPEVLMEGTHSAEDAEGALIETVAIVFDALGKAGVEAKHVILKTAMAVSGKDAAKRASPAEVAERTVRALTTAVPAEAGGVVFLSGGQGSEEACANLNAIARLEPFPWPMTFSFSRALQEPALVEWSGKEENLDEAQAIFMQRLAATALAQSGGYAGSTGAKAL